MTFHEPHIDGCSPKCRICMVIGNTVKRIFRTPSAVYITNVTMNAFKNSVFIDGINI